MRGKQTEHADIDASASHAVSQRLGEHVRASGGAGILYDSVRHARGVNVVAYRPRNVLEVVQADHFQIHAFAASQRIELRRLA